MTPGANQESGPEGLASDDESAEEEARRSGQSASAGVTAPGPALLVGVGAKLTTVFRAVDERPRATWMVSHGPVRLAAAQAIAARARGSAAARVIGAAARQVVERAHLDVLHGISCPVIGTAGIARAVIALGSVGRSKATADELHGATEKLALAWVEETKEGRTTPWVQEMMIGAAVLGAILECLDVGEIAAQVRGAGVGALDRDEAGIAGVEMAHGIRGDL